MNPCWGTIRKTTKTTARRKVRCRWRGCETWAIVPSSTPVADQLCYDHRRKRDRKRREQSEEPRSGRCVKCGGNTRQKNEAGEWFHREHDNYLFVKKSVVLEEQAALESMPAEKPTILQREAWVNDAIKYST